MTDETRNNDMIDPELLAILCCPSCKGDSKLEINEGADAMVCNQCGREFVLKKVPGPDNNGILIPELILKN